MKIVLYKIRIHTTKQSLIIWGGIKSVGKSFKRESKETQVAFRILMRIVRGKAVSDDEIKFLKGQSGDIGKALAIIGLQAVPGSSFAIIAIEKAGQKYGFTLFPKEHILPSQELTVVESNTLRVDELKESNNTTMHLN